MGYGTINNIVKNNLFMDFILGVAASSPNEEANASLIKNVFYGTGRKGNFVWWSNSTQRIIKLDKSFKIFADSNLYICHYGDDLFDSDGDGYFEPFEIWLANSGQDKNSLCDVSKLNVDNSEKLFYNATKNNIIYNLGNAIFGDIYGKIIKDTFVLKPFTSKILIGRNFEQINQEFDVFD